MQRNIFHSLFCSCLSQKGKDGTSFTVRSTQHLFTRYLFLRGNILSMIRHYELIVFQTKSVHVLKDQILFSMWLYKEKQVQIPRSLLVYLYELDLLSECHYFTFQCTRMESKYLCWNSRSVSSHPVVSAIYQGVFAPKVHARIHCSSYVHICKLFSLFFKNIQGIFFTNQ